MKEIETFADQLVKYANKYHVSDIHIVPRKQDALIQLRMDQELVQKEIIPRSVCERLISHFKFLGGMDIGERRKPQNGALTIGLEGNEVNLRLSTLPTSYDESLVIRVLPQDKITSMSHLALFKKDTQKLISLLKHSHGMIIFTGPTC
ncbi:ATPase, T2SS/T4P/T4SS family [Bacillus sp. CGMCC 1.16541]|uniref:ATPase, T2SS/T4P/T4SS family n=1 Tax=Bacillus sp. CGMCC 1.16541 TaxID=2185143 RepID=UPI000D72F2EA|nr:ATPase, T2SS/T4P/T4SS family [Bacillus sp. CGMCC 1.16541]